MLVSAMFLGMIRDLLHMPDSRPTEKQLASLLKATESTDVGFDASMGGRTFIVAKLSWAKQMRCRYQGCG